MNANEFTNASEFLNSIPRDKSSCNIESAIFKAWSLIHGYERENGSRFAMYDKIMVSVSGGSDSDIMIDMIERIGHPASEAHYAFYDTGLEFDATKHHLEYLERRYGISIERYKAKVPVPLGVKKYGLPFLNKRVSQYIRRLQRLGFAWGGQTRHLKNCARNIPVVKPPCAGGAMNGANEVR